MNIRHGKHRFGLNPDGTLYDYRSSTSRTADALFDDGSFVWDLEKVRELIESGQSIEAAIQVPSRAELQAEAIAQAAGLESAESVDDEEA